MEPDAGQLPLSHKAWAWFEANKKQTLLGAGSILVVGVIIAFFLYRQNEADIAAGEALSNVSMPQMTAGGSRPDTAEAYLKVAAAYPKSRAGARALLLAAGSLFVDGKYPEAKTQFERFKRDYSDSPFLGEALLGIAACMDAQGQTREATAAYKDVIDRHSGDSNVPHAKFALGRLHEAQNEPEKARNLFEEVERADPYGSLGDEAKMRLEDLKTKYPKLFAPIAPMPTNAVPLKVEKP
jgi:predicted negative regulator of RcsB-dependent stress response